MSSPRRAVNFAANVDGSGPVSRSAWTAPASQPVDRDDVEWTVPVTSPPTSSLQPRPRAYSSASSPGPNYSLPAVAHLLRDHDEEANLAALQRQLLAEREVTWYLNKLCDQILLVPQTTDRSSSPGGRREGASSPHGGAPVADGAILRIIDQHVGGHRHVLPLPPASGLREPAATTAPLPPKDQCQAFMAIHRITQALRTLACEHEAEALLWQRRIQETRNAADAEAEDSIAPTANGAAARVQHGLSVIGLRNVSLTDSGALPSVLHSACCTDETVRLLTGDALRHAIDRERRSLAHWLKEHDALSTQLDSVAQTVAQLRDTRDRFAVVSNDDAAKRRQLAMLRRDAMRLEKVADTRWRLLTLSLVSSLGPADANRVA